MTSRSNFKLIVYVHAYCSNTTNYVAKSNQKVKSNTTYLKMSHDVLPLWIAKPTKFLMLGRPSIHPTSPNQNTWLIASAKFWSAGEHLVI